MQDDLRDLVATGCRVLGSEGHGDLIWGHVSARDPEGRGTWMKAATWGFEEVTRDDVVLLTRDGSVIAGSGRRHAEFPIHTEILAARPDVGSVVHTHAPHAVALAATGSPLLPISHEGTLFTPPEVPRFEETGDLILTAELGARVAATLGDQRALFLVNHGIVATGRDVPTAVLGAILLERACRTQLLAVGAASTLAASDDDEALRKRDHCYNDALLEQAWDYLVRRLPGDSGSAGRRPGRRPFRRRNVRT
ncbi:class II aldolase/adducin family protein [Egicoccus sp. AB-alg6-2]|uniref:class II aldolase/adducin family protein n=1 Tax=Egicoccus sp. AB-alg6-2 TaxID=3242692 RepID=UPI00359CFC06